MRPLVALLCLTCALATKPCDASGSTSLADEGAHEWTVAETVDVADQLLSDARYQEALNTYLQILDQSDALPETIARARRGHGRALRRLARFDESLEVERDNVRFAQQHGLLAYQGHALNAMAVCHRRLGDPEAALQLYEQALEVRTEVGDPHYVATSLNNIAIIYKTLGDTVTALRFYLQSLAIHRQSGDAVEIARTLSNISSMFMDIGDYGEALRYASRLEPYFPKIENAYVLSMAKRRLGTAYLRMNQLDKARPIIEEVMAHELEVRSSRLPFMLAYRAELAQRSGNNSAALEYADQAVTEAQAFDVTTLQAALLARGRVQIAMGNLEDAKTSLQQALQLAEQSNMRLSEMAALIELADAESDTGNAKSALGYLRRYVALRDETADSVIGRQIANVGNERDRRDAALQMAQLRFDNELSSLRLDRQHKLMWAAGIIVALLIGLILVLVSRYRAVQRLATTDTLTGLRNRRFFMEQLEASVSRAEPFQVGIIDLDHFKAINDEHGHQAGDIVLRRIARLLRQHLDGTELARIGGEEFAFLCPADYPAKQRCEQLLGALRSTAPDDGPHCTASVGLSIASGTGSSLSAVLREADLALYEAKHNGRDQIIVVV